MLKEEMENMYPAWRTIPNGELQYFAQNFEKVVIEFALNKTKGNQVKAAAMIHINRNTLRKRVVRYGISVTNK